MKTSYNAGLIAFLLSNAAESIYKCDLIEVQLTQIAQTLFATDGQMPLTYLGSIYRPQQFGIWRIVSLSSKIGCMNSTCGFEMYADPGVMFPGLNLTMIQAVDAGLFEAANITVRTAYMLQYGVMTVAGSDCTGIKFQGQISKFKSVGMTKAEGIAEPDSFALSQQMPRMVLQPSCRWQLYGAGCTLAASSYTSSFTAGTPSGGSFLMVPASSMTQAAGYFSQGVVKFTGGQNAGLSCGIKQHTQVTISGTLYGMLQLDRPPLLPIGPGDTFTARAGCDHTYQTCLQKFHNTANFGGTPFIPDYTTVVG